MSAVKLVVVAGSAAIPGAGEAIDGGMIGGMEAAQLASYAYDSSTAALGAFTNWLNPCGNTSALPADMQAVFNAFNMVGPGRLPGGQLKIPPGLAKGSGRPGDAGDPNPPKEPSPPQDPNPPKGNKPPPTEKLTPTDKTAPTVKSRPTNKPTSTDKPTSTESPQSSSDKACSLGKRAPGGKNNCGVSITTARKSDAVTKLIQRTCKATSHTQACYHYYSAIQNYDNIKSTFTCSDFNGLNPANGKVERPKLIATLSWKAQHTSEVWWDYTQPLYNFKNDPQSVTEPNCQADEYPPAYFLAENTNDEQFGQLIRWIPGKENGGAAGMWKGFCAANDGGNGNFQTYTKNEEAKKHRKGSINTELVTGVGQALSEGEHEGADGTMTTTYAYDNAKFQRAVFETKFDWAGVDPPSKPDWGLKANPCWPQGIVPNDPGYVLVTNDKWYDNPPNPDYRKSYSEPPPNDLVAQAKIPTGGKRPGSPSNNNPNPPKQANTGPGGQKRALGIIEDGFVIHDVNLTRRLTDEEMKQNVEVLDCADRTCSNERRALGDDDDFIVIPGVGPQMTPPTEVDSVPTIVPRATTLETKVEKRKAISPELPAPTVATS